MSSEKNLDPTDKKIEDARKKGQIAISRDLARLVMLTVMLETVFATESVWRKAIHSLTDKSISGINQPFSVAVSLLMNDAGLLLLGVFMTCLVICVPIAVAAHWGQFGVLISSESIAPKLDKLNPVNGFTQLFSKKKLGELGLALAKAFLIGLIMFILVKDQLATIMSLSSGTPKDIYFGSMNLIRSIFHVLLGILIVLALIDFALQKYFHKSTLKMDFEEIKREYRESEGDPIVKGTRRQLARQWANENPASKTAQANAVVVNPTHFAVAMRFDETTPVPVVLTKGRDQVAQAMIASANSHGIPVIRHVWLARTLYATCRENSVVPVSSYDAVAHVYAVVNELNQRTSPERYVELEAYGDHQ